MKLYAIASAIYGGPELRSSTTIVAGEQKDAISIEKRDESSLHQLSTDDVAIVFTTFLDDIVRAASTQRQLVRSATLPVVFGWPADTDHYDLIITLTRVFPQFLTGKRFNNPCCRYETSDNFPQRVAKSKAQMARIATLVESFAAQNPLLGSNAVRFMSRGFINSARDLTRSEIDAILATPINDEEQHFMAMKERASTRPVARKQMMNQVKVWAREFVINVLRQTATNGGSRFMLTGLPHLPEMLSSVHRNCFYEDEEMRQVFAAEVIRLLELDHHIALKCPRDQSAPPFSDVAATFVADDLDLANVGMIRPQAVRVKLSQ